LNLFEYPEKIDEKFLELDKKIIYDWKTRAKKLASEIDTKKDLFE
jgi:CRISPR/Cas system-associated protein Csm6